ncbi:serine/threonine-protein kinase [Nonomuraea longicatena]|uniref:non-specific serine/threonine protein kinase n=1 Tax=Nonomuraea longicatena TaxID=83682 RepID=A0ABN1NKV8_9ACTN
MVSEQLVARRYRLLRELGRGGMGVVWEGQDTLLNRPIAIKEVLLPPGVPKADQERLLLRTTREARTAARLNHPGVVAVYDVVEEDGRPWIIMELVRAPSLEDVVVTTGALPVRQAADVGRQVLSALRAAHAEGILHRDVKPANILLADDGRVVLTDFGIAVADGDPALTATGLVTGSPGFLAPERVRADEAGPASDLWSLGATLYAAMTGRSPFERGEAMATLTALLNEEPDYRRIPPALHPVLKGLLRKEPQDRLGAEEADRLLGEILAGKRPAGAEERQEGRGGGRVKAIAAVAAFTVTLAGGVAAYMGLSSEPARTTVAQRAASSPLPVSASARPAGSPTPTAKATATPTPTSTLPRTSMPVRPWTSPDGWSIARPMGWRGARGANSTEWTRPDRAGHLSVEERYATGDPRQTLRDFEELLKEGGQEVATVRRGAVSHRGQRGVEWEFTWTAADGGPARWARAGQTYRGVKRAFAVGETTYVLSWTVSESQWQRHRQLMRTVIGSFTVGG